MPTGFLDHRSDADLNAILCHELAHVKRKDHVSGVLSELAVCLLPWQPLMWWARQRLVTLSEHACDDWVVACGYQETDYAESLLDMLPQRQFAFTPAVATRQSSLDQRAAHSPTRTVCQIPHRVDVLPRRSGGDENVRHEEFDK